jgi:hypothetical protein
MLQLLALSRWRPQIHFRYESWTVGLVGQITEQFRRVTLTAEQVLTLTIRDLTRGSRGGDRLQLALRMTGSAQASSRYRLV